MTKAEATRGLFLAPFQKLSKSSRHALAGLAGEGFAIIAVLEGFGAIEFRTGGNLPILNSDRNLLRCRFVYARRPGRPDPAPPWI
uniref:Uncharacterized protein n=1 Tax=viral metagenome TaxID=1070528 RepID=A0A6H2A2U9_9ZZZZ